MKTSEVFKATQHYLWNGQGKLKGVGHSYICVALRLAQMDEQITLDDYFKATLVVEDLLEPHDTLGDWLEAQGIKDPCADMPKLQATRHAWLDYLIDHFASIGD